MRAWSMVKHLLKGSMKGESVEQLKTRRYSRKGRGRAAQQIV